MGGYFFTLLCRNPDNVRTRELSARGECASPLQPVGKSRRTAQRVQAQSSRLCEQRAPRASDSASSVLREPRISRADTLCCSCPRSSEAQLSLQRGPALPPTRSSLRQEIILPRLDSSSLYSASSVRDKQRAPRATYSAGIVLREQHISRTAGGASIGRFAHRAPRAA